MRMVSYFVFIFFVFLVCVFFVLVSCLGGGMEALDFVVMLGFEGSYMV